MLPFDANPITIGWMSGYSYKGFDHAKNNIKQRNLNTVFVNISSTTSPTSDSFDPLDHVTYIKKIIKKYTHLFQAHTFKSRQVSIQKHY